MNEAAVPMHPEATDDPQTVRWFIPSGTLPVLGEAAQVPSPLAGMRSAGAIASITVEVRAVLIRLATGHDWATEGPHVQDALARALLDPGAWRGAGGPVGEDEVLRAVLQDVLDGAAGDYIRSHGGQVVITEVRDRRARVRMTGACAHCPAAGVTLHSRLETEVRERFPALVELRADHERCHAGSGGRPTWLTLRRAVS